MRSDDLTFESILWRHENACKTSCHRLTCFAPLFFVAFSFSCHCLETHVGMRACLRACLQCIFQHGQNFDGGCRMWVLCFGAAVVALRSGFRLRYIWDSALPFDQSP